MKIDCKRGRFQRMLGILRNQAGDHSRKNISRTSRRHARIARRIHPNRAIGRRNERAVSLEHDDQLMLVRKLARDFLTFRLNLGDGQSRQARHFSGMRRDHESPPAPA